MEKEKAQSIHLLEEFIRSCLFIHDDVQSGLITTEGQLNWDQFGTNPFFLGAEICVVDTLDGFGIEYLKYLGDLDSLPGTIIIPKYQHPSVLENLLLDETALQQLKNAAHGRHLNISSFYSDADKKFENLIAHLSENDHIPLLYPKKEKFLQMNDKIFVRNLMIDAGIPVPAGEVCFSIEQLRTVCSRNSGNGYPTLIKRLHWQTKVISIMDQVKDKLFEFPVIAERAYERICSPVSHHISFKNQNEHLFSVNQIIENWRHYGNELPFILFPNVEDRMNEYSSIITSAITGYEGVLGIDYIVTPENNVLMVDLNPRFNSSTYPFFFLKRFGIDLDSIYARFRFARVPVESLSIIFNDRSFIPFNISSQEGILLMCPVFDFTSKVVVRFLYLVVAKTQSDITIMEKVLLQLLEKHKIRLS